MSVVHPVPGSIPAAKPAMRKPSLTWQRVALWSVLLLFALVFLLPLYVMVTTSLKRFWDSIEVFDDSATSDPTEPSTFVIEVAWLPAFSARARISSATTANPAP